MNLNHQQLETLVNFSEVLTFLSNPGKLETKLKEAKDTLAEMKAYLGPKNTLEKVETYRKEQEAKYAEQLRQLGIERANDENTVTKMKSALAKMQEDTSAVKSELSTKLSSLTGIENSIAEKQKQVDALKAKLESQQVALTAKEESLAVQKAELEAKAEQLKKLLG